MSCHTDSEHLIKGLCRYFAIFPSIWYFSSNRILRIYGEPKDMDECRMQTAVSIPGGCRIKLGTVVTG